MDGTTDNPHTSSAAAKSQPEPHDLIQELAIVVRPTVALPSNVSSDLGMRYHMTLDQISDAYSFAVEHRDNNKTALGDLAALEPEFRQQVMNVKSLRLVKSSVRMKAVMDIWEGFCKEQTSNGGPTALKDSYGVKK